MGDVLVVPQPVLPVGVQPPEANNDARQDLVEKLACGLGPADHLWRQELQVGPGWYDLI